MLALTRSHEQIIVALCLFGEVSRSATVRREVGSAGRGETVCADYGVWSAPKACRSKRRSAAVHFVAGGSRWSLARDWRGGFGRMCCAPVRLKRGLEGSTTAKDEVIDDAVACFPKSMPRDIAMAPLHVARRGWLGADSQHLVLKCESARVST